MQKILTDTNRYFKLQQKKCKQEKLRDENCYNHFLPDWEISNYRGCVK